MKRVIVCFFLLFAFVQADGHGKGHGNHDEHKHIRERKEFTDEQSRREVETTVHDHGNKAEVKIKQTSMTPRVECVPGSTCEYSKIETKIKAFRHSLGMEVKNVHATIERNNHTHGKGKGKGHGEVRGREVEKESTKFKLFFKSLVEFTKISEGDDFVRGTDTLVQTKNLGYHDQSYNAEATETPLGGDDVKYTATVSGNLVDFRMTYSSKKIESENYTLPASAVKTDIIIKNFPYQQNGTRLAMGFVLEGTTDYKKASFEKGHRKYGEHSREKVRFESSDVDDGETGLFTWQDEVTCELEDGELLTVPVVVGEVREPTADDGADEDADEVVADEEADDADAADARQLAVYGKGKGDGFEGKKKQSMLYFYFDTTERCKEIVWDPTTGFEGTDVEFEAEGGMGGLLLKVGGGVVVTGALMYLFCFARRKN